jgi:tetratricopeptide (TPR) repeat protein
LFDRPADPGCIGALCKAPPIAGFTESLVDLDAAGWRLVLADLAALGLVSTAEVGVLRIRGFRKEQIDVRTGRGTGEPEEMTMPGWSRLTVVLDAHPLVREHFGNRVKEMSAAAWCEGHRRVFKHLCESTPYWPEGMEGLEPLYQGVAHGCQAGEVQQACVEVYRDRILRGASDGGFYSTFKLGAITADLGAVAWFFEPPWSRPSASLSKEVQVWLLNEAAFSLRALGRLTEAMELLQAALERDNEHQDWENASLSASSLCELSLLRGEVTEASHLAKRSVALADRGASAFRRVATWTTLADALQHTGRRAEARRVLEKAEATQAELQPSYPRLYSLQGFRYCDLLLSEAEHVAWRETVTRSAGSSSVVSLAGDLSSNPAGTTAHAHALAACNDVLLHASQTLEWVEGMLSLVDVAFDHLTLGRASLYSALLAELPPDPANSGERRPVSTADLAKAQRHLNEAVNGLRHSGDVSRLPRGLLTRAWLHALLANPTAANTDLDEAESLATRCGMPIFLADVHLTRARLFRDRTELTKARELLLDLRARGYHRHDEMLADAEMAAEGWPEEPLR